METTNIPTVPIPGRYYVINWLDQTQMYGSFIKLADARRCARSQGFIPSDPKLFKRNHPVAFVGIWNEDIMSRGDWECCYNPQFPFVKEEVSESPPPLMVDRKPLVEKIRTLLKEREIKADVWATKSAIKVRIWTHWSTYERDYARKVMERAINDIKPNGAEVSFTQPRGVVYDQLIATIKIAI